VSDAGTMTAAELLRKIRAEQAAQAVADAEAAKQRAYALLDAADYADETKAILRVIVNVGTQRHQFSANDLRTRLPEGVNRNRIGRAFGLAQDLGLIRYVSLIKSTDRGTHGKWIGLYRWVGGDES